MKTLIVVAMLAATVVIPQYAHAQAGSNVKGGKQKIIVDESRVKKNPTQPSTKLNPQPESPNIPQKNR